MMNPSMVPARPSLVVAATRSGTDHQPPISGDLSALIAADDDLVLAMDGNQHEFPVTEVDKKFVGHVVNTSAEDPNNPPGVVSPLFLAAAPDNDFIAAVVRKITTNVAGMAAKSVDDTEVVPEMKMGETELHLTSTGLLTHVFRRHKEFLKASSASSQLQLHTFVFELNRSLVILLPRPSSSTTSMQVRLLPLLTKRECLVEALLGNTDNHRCRDKHRCCD